MSRTWLCCGGRLEDLLNLCAKGDQGDDGRWVGPCRAGYEGATVIHRVRGGRCQQSRGRNQNISARVLPSADNQSADSHPKRPRVRRATGQSGVAHRMVARPTPKSERSPPGEDQSPRPVWLDSRRAGADMEGSGGKRKILSGGKKHTFFGSGVVFEGGGSLSFLPRPRLVHDRHPPPVPRGVSSLPQLYIPRRDVPLVLASSCTPSAPIAVSWVSRRTSTVAFASQPSPRPESSSVPRSYSLTRL